jgi:hypothetical protein
MRASEVVAALARDVTLKVYQAQEVVWHRARRQGTIDVIPRRPNHIESQP